MTGPVVILNPAGIAELGRDPRIATQLGAIVDREIIPDAKSGAPRLTGAGADSIHSEVDFVDGVWGVRASWDNAHYYMLFQDIGTVFMDGTHFMELALDRHANLRGD